MHIPVQTWKDDGSSKLHVVVAEPSLCCCGKRLLLLFAAGWYLLSFVPPTVPFYIGFPLNPVTS